MDKETTCVFELRLSDNKHEIAYLRLPTYPKREQQKTFKSVRLFEVMGVYKGPDVVFDFDSDGVLVGIEVLTDNFDEEDET